jgi:hypothetical protein
MTFGIRTKHRRNRLWDGKAFARNGKKYRRNHRHNHHRFTNQVPTKLRSRQQK